MIQIVKVTDPHYRWKRLEKFNPNEECLIVSDVKTKLSVEQYLLKEKKGLPDSSVLRANEFFEILFYDLKPKWQIVSDSFLQQSFLKFASEHSEFWVRNLSNPQVLISYLEFFLPILFHPENEDLIKDYFFNKKSSSLRWKHWYDLCQEYFHILLSKNRIHKSGLKSLLMYEVLNLNHSSFSKKKIIVDLGMSLDSCDYSIFKEYSSKREVEILIPEFEDKSFYKDFKRPYEDLIKDTPSSQIKRESLDESQKTSFLKEDNQTQLEEVKKATSQVRQWLDNGILEEDIVLLAPNIESYWTSLFYHMTKENIKVKKGVSSNLLDFSQVQYWLSSLNMHLGFFDFPKLETYSFYKNPKDSFSKFFSFYFKIPYRESSKGILKNPEKIKNFNDVIKGREFIEWAISLFPSDGTEVLDVVFQVFQNFPMEEELKWNSWLKILENEISLKEQQILEEDYFGISCLSFNAVNSIQSGKYIFIMGLDEKSLEVMNSTVLTQKDREDLISDLGFILPDSHPKEKEYTLLWFLQSSQLKEVIFSFPYFDFLGEVLTPSLFYILSDSLFKIEKNKREYLTVWDSCKQQKEVKDILSFPEDIKRFSDILKKKKINISFEEDIRLSANRIKIYSDCPFKYMSRYVFDLEEPHFSDRETSPLSVGNLIHKLFELILLKDNLDLSQKEIEKTIESLGCQEEDFVHKSQWVIMKNFLNKLAEDFLKKEKEKRDQFPLIKPLAFEKKIKAFWNKSKGELSDKGEYLFKGTIDRIDLNEEDQSYCVIDYKSSPDNIKNIKKWFSDDAEDFQLILYAQALEKGLVEGCEKGVISSLLYYFYKDFSRKGYVEKGGCSECDISNRAQIKQDRDVLDKTYEISNERVGKYVSRIEKGEFSPFPKDVKICEKCSWRKWCRVRLA